METLHREWLVDGDGQTPTASPVATQPPSPLSSDSVTALLPGRAKGSAKSSRVLSSVEGAAA